MTDLLISNAKIVDGTGGPAFLGDIAIKGEQISAVTGAGEGPEDAKKNNRCQGRPCHAWVRRYTHPL